VGKYVKRPVVVEAEQFAFGSRYPREAMEFLGEAGKYDPVDDVIYIETLEGTMRAKRGDMIIRGVRGELYPCDLPIFEEAYRYADE
jgi:hypothetical protein